MSTEVQILVDGEDVTNGVLFSSASFEFNQNAVPGTFEITIKDPDRNRGPYITGKEVELKLDGEVQFGGYLTQVSRKFALPADELPTDTRLWVLRGVDYNIMFDKRISRKMHDPPASLLTHFPKFYGDEMIGDLIIHFCNNRIDLPDGVTATAATIDDVALPFFLDTPDATQVGQWEQQGTPWRQQMEMMAELAQAVFYISHDKQVHFHAIEDTFADFGLSDDPNGTSTIGIRDVEATEDGSDIVNDAFVWGGSEWAAGGVVVGHEERAPSIASHGRWQAAEHHFGETHYKLQQGVTGRANLIVDGHSEAAGYDPGKRFPQWEVSATWFGENLPAGADPIRAGQLVNIDLTTFGGALSPITLPCRSMQVSFVGVDVEGKGHVQFSGQFGLSQSDPHSIWGYLRSLRRRRNGVISTATNATVESTYAAFGQFTPDSLGGGVYDLPNELGYIAGTTTVYHQGALLVRGTDYTESDPVAGEIDVSISVTGWLYVVCRTT